MDALDQSAALIRRSAELRDQSMRLRAAAAEQVENCRWLIAAAAAAQAAGSGPGAEEGLQRMSCPRAGNPAGPVVCRVRPVAS